MSRPSIHITIPKPCHERWESMNATEQGAFCHSCQKEVIDFSAMIDREVIEYLSKHKTGCGRFRKDQLDTKLTIPEVNNGVFKWKAIFLSMLSLLSLKTVLAQSNGKTTTYQTTRNKQENKTPKRSIDTLSQVVVTAKPKSKIAEEPYFMGDIMVEKPTPDFSKFFIKSDTLRRDIQH